MLESHLYALRQKHDKLERELHSESCRAARNDTLIDRLKKKKLRLKDEIERAERACG